MSFTQDDLNNVNRAIVELATGNRVTKVAFSDGHSTEYAHAKLPQLRALARDIEAALAQNHEPMNFQTSKGL